MVSCGLDIRDSGQPFEKEAPPSWIKWIRILAIFIGTFLSLDLFPRFLPGLLPSSLKVLLSQRLLDKEVYRKHALLGHCLKPSFSRDIRWGHFSLRMSHAPLPGGECGYRAASKAGGADWKRGEGPADIVVLGDSHVYGMEVDAQAAWPNILAAMSGLEVANLGVRMYGTTQSVDLYLGHCRGFKPGLVLLMLCPTDPWDNEVFAAWRAGAGISEPFVSDEMMYRVCRTLQMAGSPGFCRVVVEFGKMGLLEHILLSRSMAWLHHLRKPVSDASGMMLLQDDVRRLRSGLQGGRLAVIVNEGWPESQREALFRFLAGSGLPWAELAGTRSEGKILTFDGHWNEAGHREVASQVHDFLREAGLSSGGREERRVAR